MGYIQYGVKCLSRLNKVIYLRAPQKGLSASQGRLCFTQLFDNICSVTLDKAVARHKGIREKKVMASHTLNLDS
jgi:hypothetical protein